MKSAGREELPNIRERAFQFALRIIKLCQHLELRNGVCRALARQLLRAGTSVGANLEEAQAAQSKPDFISKNLIALKEARETSYWLRLLTASGEVREQVVSSLQQEVGELARIVGAIVVSARRGQR